MKLIAWFVWLIAVAACTDFETIQRDVCGNGLLEAGEDCDSSDASCVSCAVTCTTASDCPTPDYVCGIDQRCHAPGGALGLARRAGTFSADDMRITDIDEDGIGDALGVTQTSMIVRYGDEASQLDKFTSIITPTQTGASAFGDLDDDGSLDVAITTPDGLVSYASPYGVLAPIPVHELLLNETGMPFELDRMFSISSNMFGAFAINPASDALVMVILDGQAPGGNEFFVVPCGGRIQPITGTEFADAEVRVYNVRNANEKQLDMVFTIQAGTGASRKTCVLTLHRDVPPFLQPYPEIKLDDVTPALLTTAAPLVLADLDFDVNNVDRCPGLVRTDGGLAGLKYIDGEFLNNRCQFVATAAADLPGVPAPPGAQIVGVGPVDPLVPFVAADALITSEGVYPYIFVVGFAGAYHTNRRITEFDTGDIDGNGTVDLVFGSSGEEELDLLYRVAGEAGFNLVRLDTASTVASVTVGDYDGNGIADIAYSEQLEDHMRLMVSYGTTDRPLDPVSMGHFAEIERVSRISFGDSVDVVSIAEDLVVFQPPAPNSEISRVTFLHGNPQRVMLSYFDPRLDVFQKDTLFRGSVIGDFTNSPGSATNADLLAIAPGRVDADSAIGVRAWRVAGTADGLDATKTAGVALTGVNDCSFTNATGLCLDLARYIAFPTGPDHDVVIGVDRLGGAMMIDPWVTAGAVTATSLSAVAALIPPKSVPRSIHAADLDGDTAPELLVALAPALGSGSAGAIIVCSMTNDGIASECEDLVPAIQEAAAAIGSEVTQCYDATPVRLSYRSHDVTGGSGLDVAVACRGASSMLFRVTRTAEGNVITQLAVVGDAVSSLRAGDVTGDGIDDLVLLTGDQSTSLTVYRQCTNRDLDCLAGNP